MVQITQEDLLAVLPMQLLQVHWIIWESNDGTFDFCPASEREQDELQRHAPSDDFLNSLLSDYLSKKSTEDSDESDS